MPQTAAPPPPQTNPPSQQQQAFMVQVSPPAPERENIKDVIVGAFGLTGALVLAAVASGAVLGGLWILWSKWRRAHVDDAPPTLGSVPIAPEPFKRPPSSQDQ